MSDRAATRAASELRLALGRLVRRVRAESGVPLGQLAVLGLLDREGPQTTSDLAAVQRVRHQSMARTVGQLVALGHVAPEPHPSDKRKTLLSITPAGRDRLEGERARRVDWLARAMEEQLTVDELRLLEQAAVLLARLAAAPR
jgi:DNA-binding MarR family transcriptional regulator